MCGTNPGGSNLCSAFWRYAFGPYTTRAKYWAGRQRGKGVNSRVRAVFDIHVTDTDGSWHWLSGQGCISLPETREQIIDYLQSSYAATAEWNLDTRPHRALREGRVDEFLDENGALIPGALDKMYGPRNP